MPFKPLASTQILAGFLAVLVGLADHWAFHDGFGLTWDQAIVLAGVGYLVGVGVPPPNH